MRRILSFLPSGIAILVCAGLASAISHELVDVFGWRGAWAVIGTLGLSMVLAFGLWVLGVAALNSMRKTK